MYSLAVLQAKSLKHSSVHPSVVSVKGSRPSFRSLPGPVIQGLVWEEGRSLTMRTEGSES